MMAPPMMAPPMMPPPMISDPMVPTNQMIPGRYSTCYLIRVDVFREENKYPDLFSIRINIRSQIIGQVPNGDITQHDPSAENTLNHQEGSSFAPSADAPSAPPIFFNPSQFSSQPIQTPNM